MKPVDKNAKIIGPPGENHSSINSKAKQPISPKTAKTPPTPKTTETTTKLAIVAKLPKPEEPIIIIMKDDAKSPPLVKFGAKSLKSSEKCPTFSVTIKDGDQTFEKKHEIQEHNRATETESNTSLHRPSHQRVVAIPDEFDATKDPVDKAGYEHIVVPPIVVKKTQPIDSKPKPKRPQTDQNLLFPDRPSDRSTPSRSTTDSGSKNQKSGNRSEYSDYDSKLSRTYTGNGSPTPSDQSGGDQLSHKIPYIFYVNDVITPDLPPRISLVILLWLICFVTTMLPLVFATDWLHKINYSFYRAIDHYIPSDSPFIVLYNGHQTTR